MFASHLDDLPLPPPKRWIPAGADRQQTWIPVQGKRGCPMLCSFCSTKDIQGKAVRRRHVEAVVSWIEQVVLYGFRNFVFVDSTFNIPPSYAKELCRAIIDRDLGLNLWCILYSKWVDHELVELMARAGCREVSLGFESGSDRMLKSYNKRFRAADVHTVCGMLAEVGIRRTGFLLLGGPGEDKASVEESLRFADSLKLDALKITMGLRIYPQTALAATAVAEGIIAPDDDLLWPRFYLAPGLAEWLPQTVAAYRASRAWIM